MSATTTRNPANEEILRAYPESTPEQISSLLARADTCFKSSLIEPRAELRARRKKTLLAFADQLDTHLETHARLITDEMGKTLKHAREEVKKCASTLRLLVEDADRLFAPRLHPRGEGFQAWTEWDPIGTLYAIMPWNFPFWQAVRAFAPSYLLGNSFVLKHASNVTGSALALKQAFDSVGGEPGSFELVILAGERALSLIDDPRITAVTLTGSEGAGKQVAARAGLNLKKCVLELGGSDPFVVLDSAPLESTIEKAVQSRLLSNGHSCIAAKRFLVARTLYPDFLNGLRARLNRIIIGDPIDEKTDLGPLVNRAAVEALETFVRDTIDAGAVVESFGEKQLPLAGTYFAPRIVTNLPKGHALRQVETFGHVFFVEPFDSLEQAAELANETLFGLGASCWGENETERKILRGLIRSGMFFENSIVASHARLPFGGIKYSGYGRELGTDGCLEFAVSRTCVVGPS